MNEEDTGDGLEARLSKAQKTSITWAALAGAGAILTVGTFFADVLPATITLGIASGASIWRYLGAADKAQQLEHQVADRNGTGAGEFWAGK